MTYRLAIRQEALADIEQAAAWYEGQEPGIGIDFARTITSAIEALPDNPLLYRIRERRHNVRWFLRDPFPHRIIYCLQDDLITVFAVVHSARHDREWRRRLGVKKQNL